MKSSDRLFSGGLTAVVYILTFSVIYDRKNQRPPAELGV
jgi:hypothetical protein